MANYIPQEKIVEIKHSADIVDIISEHVLLKKAGRNWVGLCPFHSEKTPSFTVNPEKQIFHCFGCGEGGNVFTFLIKHEGFSFPEAVKSLAGRYGIQVSDQHMTPDQKRRLNEREMIFSANQAAMTYFREMILDRQIGETARAYLERRGIKKETVDRFQIGYVPDGWDNLVRRFSGIGISNAIAEKSGLIVRRRSGSGFYDRFRHRIIFPIFNIRGGVAGFGGRALDDSQPPKYLNSPETPVYNKSKLLYGLNISKNKCRQTGTVFVVEGYLDLLALYQHGIENCVATLGTAFTHEHARIIKGVSDRVILVFDADDAGRKAAVRSLKIFIDEGLDAQVMVLPEGHDPDSFVFKFGAEAFTRKAAQSASIMTFVMDEAVRVHGLSVEGKVRVVEEMRQLISSLDDPVARSLYIKELAERIQVDETAIQQKIDVGGVRKQESFQSNPHVNDPHERGISGDQNRLEQTIIRMMIQFPQILPDVRDRKIIDEFEDEQYRSIGRSLLDCERLSEDEPFDVAGIIDDMNKQKLAASLAMQSDVWDHESCLRLIDQYQASRGRRNHHLLEKIKQAETDNNRELLMKLLKEKQALAKKRL